MSEDGLIVDPGCEVLKDTLARSHVNQHGAYQLLRAKDTQKSVN